MTHIINMKIIKKNNDEIESYKTDIIPWNWKLYMMKLIYKKKSIQRRIIWLYKVNEIVLTLKNLFNLLKK